MKTYHKYLGEDQNTYVKCLVNDHKAPNVIFFMTPIGSVDQDIAVRNYRPLAENGFNVFAVDLPGIGNSSKGKFTYENIKSAIRNVGEYIGENYSATIHLYGGTGTGGIIGQALASDKDLGIFKTYSQLGVANHGDLSVIGNGFMLKSVFPILKIGVKFFPRYRLKFKVPKYSGYNGEKENDWYQSMMEENPGIFDLPLDVVYTLLWLFLGKSSPIKGKPIIPTLVMATEHDRYYKKEYINKYYRSLTKDKKLYWIDDSHCVFVWNAGELVSQVTEWITSQKED